jgi:hypothetical protein
MKTDWNDIFGDFFKPGGAFSGVTSKPLPDTPRAKELRPVIADLEGCIYLTKEARDAWRTIAERTK